MVALTIEEQKTFTAGLFIGEIFDRFLVREAEIVTFNRFTVDGRLRRGYYSDEESKENGSGEFSSWGTLKPFCFSLIKGSRLPESFRLVFKLPPGGVEQFLTSRLPSFPADQVDGLYVNVRYEGGEMMCVTGTSINVFTLDKTLEREWDESVRQFLKKNGVVFEERG